MSIKKIVKWFKKTEKTIKTDWVALKVKATNDLGVLKAEIDSKVVEIEAFVATQEPAIKAKIADVLANIKTEAAKIESKVKELTGHADVLAEDLETKLKDKIKAEFDIIKSKISDELMIEIKAIVDKVV